MTEILLKVALNTIKPIYFCCLCLLHLDCNSLLVSRYLYFCFAIIILEVRYINLGASNPTFAYVKPSGTMV